MKEYKEVTLPLKIEELQNFIKDENKNIAYIVNYKESQLRDLILFNYVSNLELPIEISFEGSTLEEKFSLMAAYMSTRTMCLCESLLLNITYVLLLHRGVDVPGDMYLNLELTQDEAMQFIEENNELVNLWENFIASSIIYGASCLQGEQVPEEIRYPSFVDMDGLETIDNMFAVGANIAFTFSIPSFVEYFFSIKKEVELKYYKQQFEEYIYKGQNLFQFYLTSANTPFLTLLGMLNSDITLQQITELGAISRHILSHSQQPHA